MSKQTEIGAMTNAIGFVVFNDGREVAIDERGVEVIDCEGVEIALARAAAEAAWDALDKERNG